MAECHKERQMKWKTGMGRVLDVSEMTDLHLANAINYCRNLKQWDSLNGLLDEQQHRFDLAFFSQTALCEHCGGEMQIKTHEVIEVGWGETKYQLKCKCGAAGPYLERPFASHTPTRRKLPSPAERSPSNTDDSHDDAEMAEYRQRRHKSRMREVYGDEPDDPGFGVF